MDAAEFDAFYTESASRLVGQLTLLIGDHAEAQDCVQEAFVRAWNHRHSLSRDGHPGAVGAHHQATAGGQPLAAARGRPAGLREEGGDLPEHDMSDLTARLRAVTDDAANHTDILSTIGVRRRAQRRQAIHVAVAAAAVAVVIVVGFVLGGDVVADRSVGPAATVTVTGEPTGNPSITSTTTTAASSTLANPTLLPHEVNGGLGWTPTGLTSLNLDPCRTGASFDGDAVRQQWRSESRIEGDSFSSEEIGYYVSADAAAAAAAELVDRVRSCPVDEYADPQLGRTVTTTWSQDRIFRPSDPGTFQRIWADSESVDSAGTQYPFGGPLLIIYQNERTVLLISHDGETDCTSVVAVEPVTPGLMDQIRPWITAYYA